MILLVCVCVCVRVSVCVSVCVWVSLSIAWGLSVLTGLILLRLGEMTHGVESFFSRFHLVVQPLSPLPSPPLPPPSHISHAQLHP